MLSSLQCIEQKIDTKIYVFTHNMLHFKQSNPLHNPVNSMESLGGLLPFSAFQMVSCTANSSSSSSSSGADGRRFARFNCPPKAPTLLFKSINGGRREGAAEASELRTYSRNPSESTSGGRMGNIADSSESDSERGNEPELLDDDYPLFVDEEDPNWPEEAEDGWGFKLSEFFNEVKIKNVRDEEDEDYLTEDEMEWEDDDYACTVKVMTSKEWEDAVFRDISPLVLLIYERYERAKDNWKARKELDRAIHIFWDSNKPSPRAFMVDAAIETELVSALKVEDCPVILFIKAGRILHRETEILTAEEFAKIMAYFYYGASRPACLKNMEPILDEVPSLV